MYCPPFSVNFLKQITKQLYYDDRSRTTAFYRNHANHCTFNCYVHLNQTAEAPHRALNINLQCYLKASACLKFFTVLIVASKTFESVNCLKFSSLLLFTVQSLDHMPCTSTRITSKT